ncbi:MAG: TIGR00266 family protein [Peptostreptococcaceae bacterium]|jgi:uncharacterized protein (TIGR00266 family)|nr:TIGR00266 family protein [Peptostreptococcaceae bacterium]
MNYEILHEGGFPMVKVKLDAGEKIKAESGAMIAMEDTIDVAGKMEGGVLGGIGRMFAGEKFFFQTLEANRGAGEVLFAHVAPGGIKAIELDGMTEWKIQKDGFLASSDTVDIDTKIQNLTKGLFSGEGFFVLGARGKGTLFVSSYGSIHELEIQPGREYVIDNEHLVAWEASLEYKIEKASASGWISSFTSGEGLVCRFKGPGKVYIQTRNPSGFGSWVRGFIPSK